VDVQAVATAVAGVAQRQLREAPQRLRRVRPLEALVPHRLHRQAELHQRMERRQRPPVAADEARLPVVPVVVAAVAGGISPAHPTLTAPLTPISPRSLATRTVCRR